VLRFGVLACAVLMAAASAPRTFAGSEPLVRVASRDSSDARIATQRSGDEWRVRGVFENRDTLQADTLSYTLTVQRDGPSGTLKTRQSGTFATAPGRTDSLSTVSLTALRGATLQLRLVVRAEGALVDTARVERTVRRQ
jgi:hypothetical protein